MRIDKRLGTFEEVAASAPEHVDTLAAVRSLAQEMHPDAFEVASTRERSVWWGWGAGKMKEGYAYAMPHKAHVNLGFFQGAALPDPARLLQGTGKMLRHVKLEDARAATEPTVRALFAAARDERRTALGL
jgi:hypothetical protein